jgi:hypothetical protein
MDVTQENGLTEEQNAALEITERFLEKLHRNGVSIEDALYEAYKFCNAALHVDRETVTRMDVSAAIIGRAALSVGIHPDQQRAARISYSQRVY